VSAYAIIGMQFGSEGKGALAGYLAKERAPQVFMSNWSPNAGHTYRADKDHKLVVRMIPIGAFTSPDARVVLIGPGSLIDPEIFLKEVAGLPRHVAVIVHPNAALVLPEHRSAEKDYARIGSTMKGSAAASIARMHRDPTTPCTAGQLPHLLGNVTVSDQWYFKWLFKAIEHDMTIQIEGCQGFSLSMYHGFYPYVTSRDTTIHQLKADIAWPASFPMEVYGCVRTFPIRVANRAEGTSGPCYPDQREISFEDIGVETEYTTVTNLPRRVFTYSCLQIEQAVVANGITDLYLSFCDYLDGDDAQLSRHIQHLEQCINKRLRWCSYGPYHNNMVNRIGIQEGPKVQSH
jgi:adenylosuccinate synthase